MSNMTWVVVLTLSTCAIIFSAAMAEPKTFLALTALVSLAISLTAIREFYGLEDAGAPKRVMNSSIARYMGLVWCWAAMCMMVSYNLTLAGTWTEWWKYFLVFAFMATGCMFYSTLLEREEAVASTDEKIIGLFRPFATAQMAAIVIAMGWLTLDRKAPLMSTASPDWLANIIFFGGAIALTAISSYALLRDPATKGWSKLT
jgi:hypothetical protein